MQKTQELLLILTNEEREAAENFIQRKLKFLDSDALTDLELVGSTARSVLSQTQQDAGRFDTTSRAGKVLARIYANAQEGLAHLIRECNLAVSQKKREIPETGEEAEGKSADLEGLTIQVDEEEEDHAWSVIESSIAEMDTPQIRELRDATEELLGWWQTDGGMHESLHINQWGDVNQANGRIAIRKVREEHQLQEIGPFRAFFQTVNLIYQKKNQEIQNAARQKRLREEAGLGQ
jgi:hypothetical protein